MKRYWLMSVLAVSITACAGSGGSSKKFADGLVFAVELLEEGEKKIGRDRLTIDSGLESEAGRAQGFVKGAIEIHGVKGNFGFTARTKTALGYEEKTWVGKVEGDRISGYYIWNQRGKPPVKVTFEGNLVLPAKPAAPPIVPPPKPSMPAPAVPTPSTAQPR